MDRDLVSIVDVVLFVCFFFFFFDARISTVLEIAHVRIGFVVVIIFLILSNCWSNLCVVGEFSHLIPPTNSFIVVVTVHNAPPLSILRLVFELSTNWW